MSSRVRDLPGPAGELPEGPEPEDPGARPVRTPDPVELEKQPATPGSRYDVVLADPPYALATDDLHDALTLLADVWLEAGAVLVVERDRKSGPIRWPDGVNGLRDRAYGETVLWYGRSAGTDVPG
nr:RsmD family RNA methyltransferase [Phytoactinopolyspora mesophila]